MSKQQLTSEPLDEETLAEFDRICEHLGGSREHLVATAILRFLHEELRRLPSRASEGEHLPPFVETDSLALALDEAEGKAARALGAYLQPAEDDIEAGRVLTQDEMERWFANRVEARRRPAAAE